MCVPCRCPLKVWHAHLFQNYCSVRTLNSAVIRLLHLRRFSLSLDAEEVAEDFPGRGVRNAVSEGLRTPSMRLGDI